MADKDGDDKPQLLSPIKIGTVQAVGGLHPRRDLPECRRHGQFRRAPGVSPGRAARTYLTRGG